MISIMLSLFSFQALEKLDLEILGFWSFTELSIWSGFRIGVSNMHLFVYVRIFKVQLLSDRVHGCFLQYVFFKFVVDIVYALKIKIFGTRRGSNEINKGMESFSCSHRLSFKNLL